MLPDFKKIIEVFECMSLDNNAYFTLQNQDDLKVCIQYKKNLTKKDWSIWFASHETNSKQIITSQHLLAVLEAFKISDRDVVNEISHMLLIQAAFADEFIRQMTNLFGIEAVQKSILSTQNFMDELSQSVEQVFKKPPSLTPKNQSDRKGLRVIK